MGCEASRDHHPEDTIEANEKALGFSDLTVSEIQQVKIQNHNIII